MNREFLEELGLEKDAIDQIMAEHGKTLNATKQQLADVEQERDTLNDELKARDEQLKGLKEMDPEALQQKITQLEQENQQARDKYESELKDVRLNSAIKLAIAGQVHDEDLVAGLFDKEKLVIDGEKIVGLEDQLKSLQEEKSFLFLEQESSQDGEQSEQQPAGFRVGGDGQGNAVPKTEAQQWVDAFSND